MAADVHRQSRDARLGTIGKWLWAYLSKTSPVQGVRQPAMELYLRDSLLCLAWALAPGRERCHKA
jgi:hypothetical protein